MKTIRQINTKNRPGYFFNGMTNINDFDPSLLNIDEVVLESDGLTMYGIKYIKDLYTSNSLYLGFNNSDACIENSCLIFASAEKNKSMLGIYKELWDEIKDQIELITGDKVTKYSKDFMKIRFKTNVDLPSNKIVNITVCVVILSSFFKEDDGEYYQQALLHDYFYEYEENINPRVV